VIELLPHRNGEADVAGLAGFVPDLLCGLDVVDRLGVEDVGYEGLRVAVVEREECGLHLHHEAMACGNGAIDHGETEGELGGLVGVRTAGLGTPVSQGCRGGRQPDEKRVFEDLAGAPVHDVSISALAF